jgi:hypothetical protein
MIALAKTYSRVPKPRARQPEGRVDLRSLDERLASIADEAATKVARDFEAQVRRQLRQQARKQKGK